MRNQLLVENSSIAANDGKTKGRASELSGNGHNRWGHHFSHSRNGTFLNLAIIAGALLAHLFGDWFAPAHPHFDDFLASIILMGVTGALVRDRRHDWIVQPLGATFVVTSAAFSWEVVAPNVLKNSTGDWLDVLAYWAGGAVYVAIRQFSDSAVRCEMGATARGSIGTLSISRRTKKWDD